MTVQFLRTYDDSCASVKCVLVTVTICNGANVGLIGDVRYKRPGAQINGGRTRAL